MKILIPLLFLFSPVIYAKQVAVNSNTFGCKDQATLNEVYEIKNSDDKLYARTELINLIRERKCSYLRKGNYFNKLDKENSFVKIYRDINRSEIWVSEFEVYDI